MLLLILRLLLHPSISAPEPLPAGRTSSACWTKAVSKHNRPTCMRTGFVGTISKVDTGRGCVGRCIGAMVGALVRSRCRGAGQASTATATKETMSLLRRLLLLTYWTLILPDSARGRRYISIGTKEIVNRWRVANDLVGPQSTAERRGGLRGQSSIILILRCGQVVVGIGAAGVHNDGSAAAAATARLPPNHKAVAGFKSGSEGVVRVATDAGVGALGIAVGWRRLVVHQWWLLLLLLQQLAMIFAYGRNARGLLPTVASGLLLSGRTSRRRRSCG